MAMRKRAARELVRGLLVTNLRKKKKSVQKWWLPADMSEKDVQQVKDAMDWWAEKLEGKNPVEDPGVEDA